jgi:hypothetical protein
MRSVDTFFPRACCNLLAGHHPLAKDVRIGELLALGEWRRVQPWFAPKVAAQLEHLSRGEAECCSEL